MPKLILNINLRELDALVKMAIDEYRNPRDQAHFLLKQKLSENGLLDEQPASNANRLDGMQLIEKKVGHE